MSVATIARARSGRASGTIAQPVPTSSQRSARPGGTQPTRWWLESSGHVVLQSQHTSDEPTGTIDTGANTWGVASASSASTRKSRARSPA